MRELPQRVLERLITDFDKDHWKKICSTFWLSEELIDKYSDRLNWDEVSFHQKLNYAAIDKYADKLNWKYVSQYQKLSEELIDKYSSKVDWSHIFRDQELSEDFIRKNMSKLDTSGEIQLLIKLTKHNYSEELQLFVLKKLLQKYNYNKAILMSSFCTPTPFMKEQLEKYSILL
jgi:Txe/YoeB family toxin of Txe-Axe toxin-antitoxin module